MKTSRYLLAIVAFAGLFMTANAQNCDLRISIAPIEQGESVPNSINSRIENQLMRAVSSYGVSADPYYCQFFISGRLDHALDDVVPGPPARYVLKTTFTIYIGDAINKQVYASTSFDLKGVGNTQERAYISALSSISNHTNQLAGVIEKAKAKIIDYYNNNYQSYLSKARLAMSKRNYDEALYYASSIPECCVGYKKACDVIMQVYQSNVDYDGDLLLAQAKAAWAAKPDEDGAREAWSFLSRIDPSASCYGTAMSLGNQIQKVIKENWDFEYKEKYRNEIDLERRRIAADHDLERRRIAAARDAAVAYAKNQPRVITNFVIRNNNYHFHRYY